MLRMKRAALSASRAKDFQQCPLMFRLRVVDKIPEPPSAAAVRGTLVHAVLEHLFNLPADQRQEEAALALVEPRWRALVEQRPEVTQVAPEAGDAAAFLAQARALVSNYFRVENPRRLQPAARERFVEVELDSGLLLRGFMDRVDVAPNGAVRVVDYKTGKAPGPRFTAEALFQMKFYALMLWRLEGTAPARLQLIYLADGRTLTLDPLPEELAAFERDVMHLWDQIERAVHSQQFAARKTRLCDWCSFQQLCPAFGGTTPPVPEDGLRALAAARRGALPFGVEEGQ